MVHVEADDLADDVRSKRQLRGLQQWSTEVMSRYSAGRLLTNRPAAYWSGGTIELAPSEIPRWLKHAWRNEPEVSIRLTDSGTPECVIIGWYDVRVEVGPTNYHENTNYGESLIPWYIVEAKPGVYVRPHFK
jgi:hypothetical protein